MYIYFSAIHKIPTRFSTWVRVTHFTHSHVYGKCSKQSSLQFLFSQTFTSDVYFQGYESDWWVVVEIEIIDKNPVVAFPIEAASVLTWSKKGPETKQGAKRHVILLWTYTYTYYYGLF